MPKYDRWCSRCGYTVEVVESMNANHPVPCPKCGGDMFRRMPLVQPPQGGDTPRHHK